MVFVERRSGKDRRSGLDRRKFNDPNYKGPERRVAVIGDPELIGEKLGNLK